MNHTTTTRLIEVIEPTRISPPTPNQPSITGKSLTSLPRPRTNIGALCVVVGVVLYLLFSWTYLRVYDSRYDMPGIFPIRLIHTWQVSLQYVALVWVICALLIWSLIQTHRNQSQNWVNRSDQIIPQLDQRRLSELARSSGVGSAGSTTTEDELLYDLPDLFEFIPGFICEMPAGVDCTQGEIDSPQKMSPEVPISPSKRLAPPLMTWNSSSNGAPGSTASSTPHILLPTLTHKVNGCRRWCQWCHLYKPDRSHHCHRCSRCILKMDHHCIFISSCIGFHNYKSFILFLFYALIGTTMIVVDCYNSSIMDSFRVTVPLKALLLAGTFTLAGSLMLVLPLFLGFHFRIALLEGCTTLEFNELREKREKYLGVKKYLHPYKLPIFQQFKQIFGFSIWKWILPIPVYAGNKQIIPAAVSSLTRGKEPIDDILRTSGRERVDSDSIGADVELDELSAVPLLSSFTSSGTPIGASVGVSTSSTKSLEATRELALWEATHSIPQSQSHFERTLPHPIYDSSTIELYSRTARLRKAAQGVLGRAEETLMAEWCAKGLMFPVGPTIVQPQLLLWRESKLFKQA